MSKLYLLGTKNNKTKSCEDENISFYFLSRMKNLFNPFFIKLKII